MSQAGGGGANVGGGQSPGCVVVGRVRQYLADWGGLLSGGELPSATQRLVLHQFGARLAEEASDAGLAAIETKLAAIAHLSQPGPPLDLARLRWELQQLSETSWRVRQSLAPHEQAWVDQVGAPQGPPVVAMPPVAMPPVIGTPPGVAMPPMLTIHPRGRGSSPPIGGSPRPDGGSALPVARALTPPPILSSMNVLAGTRVSASGPPALMPDVALPRSPAMPAEPSPLPPMGQAPPALVPRAPSPPLPGVRSSLPPAADIDHARPALLGLGAGGDARRVPPDERAAAPPVSAPRLAVRTMFGLRAFGKPGAPAAPFAGVNRPAQPGGGGLLGLGRSAPSAPPLPGFGGSGGGKPQMLSADVPGLPPAMVPGRSGNTDQRTGLTDLLRRVGKEQRPSSPSAPPDRNAPAHFSRRVSGTGARRVAQPPSLGWIYVLLGVVAAGVLCVAGVVAWSRLHDPARAGNGVPATAKSGAQSSGVGVAAPSDSSGRTDLSGPREKLTTDDERLKAIVAQMEGHGGKVTPELHSQVEEEGAVLTRFVQTGTCEGDPRRCAAMTKSRELVKGSGGRLIARRERHPVDRRRTRWFTGSNLPDIPVTDDPRVRTEYEKYTENPVYRERFQQMLWQCGAYRELIQATLVRYQVPSGALAVVFAESGCYPLAESHVGARGLWQFMPYTGRAYHMRVIEDLVDERLSPPKATEGAVHFLADLYQKLGDWELAFASYNLGPFGVLARMQRAGGDVTFWDLADADLLPDETANYVPTIEAFALILENLKQLKFASAQMKPPEITADLEAPPGTRLSLVARAAATSASQIRAMNLDIVGDRVPSLPGERFAVKIPKEAVWQAREALDDLLTRSSDEDQCVPGTFDWGKSRFTSAMAEACRRRVRAPVVPPVDSRQ